MILHYYDLLTWLIWVIIGIDSKISTMTIPIVSADISKHFETLGEILQQQQVVVSRSGELESKPFPMFFTAFPLYVDLKELFSLDIESSNFSTVDFGLDRWTAFLPTSIFFAV